ncbi:unnamed protein product, partial [Amoebophrya sp. A25]
LVWFFELLISVQLSCIQLRKISYFGPFVPRWLSPWLGRGHRREFAPHFSGVLWIFQVLPIPFISVQLPAVLIPFLESGHLGEFIISNKDAMKTPRQEQETESDSETETDEDDVEGGDKITGKDDLHLQQERLCNPTSRSSRASSTLYTPPPSRRRVTTSSGRSQSRNKIANAKNLTITSATRTPTSASRGNLVNRLDVSRVPIRNLVEQ